MEHHGQSTCISIDVIKTSGSGFSAIDSHSTCEWTEKSKDKANVVEMLLDCDILDDSSVHDDETYHRLLLNCIGSATAAADNLTDANGGQFDWFLQDVDACDGHFNNYPTGMESTCEMARAFPHERSDSMKSVYDTVSQPSININNIFSTAQRIEQNTDPAVMFQNPSQSVGSIVQKEASSSTQVALMRCPTTETPPFILSTEGKEHSFDSNQVNGDYDVDVSTTDTEGLGLLPLLPNFASNKASLGLSSPSNTKSDIAAFASIPTSTSHVHQYNIPLVMTEGKREVDWNSKFDELNAFTAQYRHPNVPQNYEKNPSLGRWVARQRLFMREWEGASADGNREIMSGQTYTFTHMDLHKRMKLLKSIGFEASLGRGAFGKSADLSSRKTNSWERSFAALVEYKKQNGNCDVPYKYSPDKSLALWVMNQRRKYKQLNGNSVNNELRERFQRLENLGFRWKIGSGSWKRRNKNLRSK